MKFSQNFIKTLKSVSSEIESTNGKLLTQAGYIHQEVAGVYTFMPLGIRVLQKVENIVRKHMDRIGSEVLMTSLHPKSLWEQTKRLESIDVLFEARGANAASRERNGTSYVLAPTHEDMITPLVQQFVQSYRDLPVTVYQIQTKFRNEARAKSGLLRGREFRMKDLYSFHISQEDLMSYYEKVKSVYLDVYAELGLGESTFITLASGGDFTKEFSHEFQTVLETGEDLIYLDRANKIAYNKEVVTPENSKKLKVDFDSLEQVKASEVGNIFPLGTKYSEAFNYKITDSDGSEKIVWMGSYGIGTSRIMGVLVEKFADERGIVWPESVAPFKYHLVTDNDPEAVKAADALYKEYQDQILWDDRESVKIGEKLFDADLIGCPYRVIISKRSLENGGFEIKARAESEGKIVKKLSDI